MSRLGMYASTMRTLTSSKSTCNITFTCTCTCTFNIHYITFDRSDILSMYLYMATLTCTCTCTCSSHVLVFDLMFFMLCTFLFIKGIIVYIIQLHVHLHVTHLIVTLGCSPTPNIDAHTCTFTYIYAVYSHIHVFVHVTHLIVTLRFSNA